MAASVPHSSLEVSSYASPPATLTHSEAAEYAVYSNRSRKRPRSESFSSPRDTDLPQPSWPNGIQEEFAADLCRLFIACNIAWWAVEHPFFRYFFSKWLPGAILPGRMTLGGRILEAEAGKVINDMRCRVKGRFASGQCDGWKSIAKNSIVASVVNVECIPWLLNVFDISAAVKNAEKLLAIVIGEIKYIQEELGTTVVAWCTDASGESRKMRRLLREKIPWIVTLDCWAHQVSANQD
ncbi:hypothetical protein OBBRIDRAFT_741963 [Obba rivulosa]|uniref:DUF659 domain-containing protein n=1 Tax=Obba rivulosa TaxID=1052685 RepID=A0A8E2ALT9_9APHY|nr:hypothetical protein OBBRIDRAFT_741963 [Obba rivulosa]